MNLRTAFRSLRWSAIPFAMMLATASPFFAQGDNQRCEGTVTDDQGNPLAGVTISFLDLERNLEAQPVKTNKKGRYAHNILRASTDPGWEIRATLEGHKIVKITVLTTKGDGTKVGDDEYMVGADQKGLHKVPVPAQSRSDITSKGKCVADFIMAPEDRFGEAFRRLQAEKLAKEGKAPAPEAAATPVVPGTPSGITPAAAASADPLEKAKSMIASQDYAGAIAPAREAVAAKADSAEAHRWLGMALLKVDNMAEAEPELKKALELDPNIVGLNFDMGSLYIKKGRLMQAIPHFEKERELNPESMAVLQNLGKLYADTNQYDKAVEMYAKMVELAPDSIECYGLLADAYKQKGDTAKELETYQKMGAQDPSGQAFYNLGNLMFNKNEMEKAADAYKKAIQQAPDNAQAHYQLGLTLVNLGKFKEAVTELETFVKLKPKDPKSDEAKSLAADLRKMGG